MFEFCPYFIQPFVVDFLFQKWADWHEEVLTPNQVKKSAGSKLLSSKTHLKKREKQTADDDDDSSPSNISRGI